MSDDLGQDFLPLTDEKGFRGPEQAAFHAQYVQGGYTTATRETARMLLDGGEGEKRALAWMVEKGLELTDLEWDSGMLAEYLARHEAGGRLHLSLLASYARGPRIWDAAENFEIVCDLAAKGLIEPVTEPRDEEDHDPAGRGVFQLTDAGRQVLAGIGRLPS